MAMNTNENHAILLVCCPDRSGLIAAVADFIQQHHGNVYDLEEHVDRDTNTFFMRVVWKMQGFDLDRENFDKEFSKLAEPLDMRWSLHCSSHKKRVAILVSKASHCLYDLLSRHADGSLPGEVVLVASNHDDLREDAERFGLPYYHCPITDGDKASQEAAVLRLLAEHAIDLVVLARYMQILSADFISHYPRRIINIHHSFLPAFTGAKPYHQAHERGVKIIGATSHYVTKDLDEGPIIAQDVEPVTHEHEVADLVAFGKDIEKIVLAKAVRWHLEHKILTHGNRTIVFS